MLLVTLAVYSPETFTVSYRTILLERDIAFQVAPYGALAQLAYLDGYQDYIDVVAAPSEILFYEIDKAITNLDFDVSEYTWVRKKALVDEYGGNPDKFRDACILVGSSIIPPLPQLSHRAPRMRYAPRYDESIW